MTRLMITLGAVVCATALPAQAATLKALSFEGTLVSGADWSGNVFFNAPTLLTGQSISGRFVFDLDKIVGGGVTAFAANHADYDDPLHPAGGGYGGTTGPFMQAFVTINGREYEIENAAQPTLPGPIRHSLTFDDQANPAQDSVGAGVTSFRPAVCFGCTISEYMQLSVIGAAGGLLSGENFGQNFDVALVNNIYSFVQFQILSGYQVNAGTYIPSTPNFGVESYHYASGAATLTRLSLQDVTAVPEPSSWASMLAGCGALLIWRRRRAAQHSTVR